MPPYLRVKKTRHCPRYPTQVQAHAVFRGCKIYCFWRHGVHIHFTDWLCQILFPWDSTGELRIGCPIRESVDRLKR